ncbi:MAG: amidohydrolase family protein [Candidatus Eisenbacteria bacterium]|nr:amidohydrolase family protein [Candidatus Eisenbacteria bacterium]
MPHSKTLLTGTIRTTAFDDPADWLIFSDGRVQRSGRGRPPDEPDSVCRTLSLPRGAVAVPVLHDAHVHLMGTGLLGLGVDLSGVSEVAEALELLRSAARDHEGPVLRAHSFEPDTLTEPRYPTMSELDSAVGERPVFVRRRDGHSSAVNSAAFELMGLTAETTGVVTDAAGAPNGTLTRDAHSLAASVSAELVTREEAVGALRLASEAALRAGAGVVHALVGRSDPEDREIELVLDVEDELPVDVVVYPQTTDVDRVAALGLPRIGGCILLDGSFGSRSAALMSPYDDGEGDGTLYFDDDELVSFLRRAHARGMQTALHAIGDRAILQAVRCLERAAGGEAADARHRIEHCELVGPAALSRIARLGVGVCVQPAFERFWGGPGGLYERRLGAARMRSTNPLRAMLDAGIPLGGGSDSYVTPIDPLGGMAAAVAHPTPEHRIEPAEALDLFTRGAARLAFDEARVGTLLPGAEASFTVLGRDPVEAGGEVDGISVLGVYLRGRRVYSGPS